MAVPWPESSKGESGGRSEPASTVLPRRVAHGAHDLQGNLGPRRNLKGEIWGAGNRVRRSCLANARGLSTSQGERNLEADAEAISWMCPYAVCLVAEFDRRLWLKEALSPYVFSRKRDGGRGGREPGLRMTIVQSRVRCSRRRALSERSFSLRSYAWRREP